MVRLFNRRLNLLIVIFLQLHLLDLFSQRTLHVDLNNKTGNNSGTFMFPLCNISHAIALANHGDTIKVAGGLYSESIVIDNKRMFLFGSYEGGDSIAYAEGRGGRFSESDTAVWISHLLGTVDRAVVDFRGACSGSVLAGFKISGGQRGIYIDDLFSWPPPDSILIMQNSIVDNGWNEWNEEQGGGVRIRGNGHILVHNTIANNKAGRGGGVASAGRNNVIAYNRIAYNVANSDHGGGLYLFGNPVLAFNDTSYNEVGRLVGYGWGGGALFLESGGDTAVSRSNIYHHNTAPTYGAAVFVDEAAILDMAHDLIVRNQTTGSSHGGAGIAVDRRWDGLGSSIKVRFTTVANNYNQFGRSGNGLYIDQNCNASVTNSIFWNNDGDIYLHPSSSLQCSWSILEDQIPGEGVFHRDPLFADTVSLVYALRSTQGRLQNDQWISDSDHSPAIDASDPLSEFSLEPLPNGDRANAGHHGNTDRASLTFTLSDRSHDSCKNHQIWPNPFTDYIQLSSMKAAAKLMLYDTKGNVVWASNLQSSEDGIIRIPLHIMSGLYYLVIRESDRVEQHVVIKR
jgi:hypothetical protein